MATASENSKTKTKMVLQKIWKWSKKIFLWLFIFQLFCIILFKWVNPPITITQLSSWIGGHGLQRDYVGRNQISPNAKLAVIAAEDQTFPDHSGFDWQSIKKAMKYNEEHDNKRRGASTISQQVAKNVFLWQGGGFFRKGLEVYFTFMIELIWGKKRILEVYLNVIEMGEGIFGIEMASQKYFNKPSKNLTQAEAALIAACLPNPKRYTVKPLSSYVAQRAQWVQRQMNNLRSDPDVQKVTGIQSP
ncbi:MAG: Penicillin-binding protein 2D [Bacteroidetes bacterium ADurb.BinA245]|jgi:monofunctional biosynthetic peptidoglycan transglycosylase|nr:MAG: Penicillin-binding protein 2D [Bacteroidetes bacterium ADurb.BinA245]